MRTTGTSAMLKAKAIAGTHVVVLAWDLQTGQKSKLNGLLGFAVWRTEFNGLTVVESYPLRSIKRFRDKDKGYPPGTLVSTADHPIQSFQWADYTAKSGKKYEYRIVPLYGTPKLLQPNDSAAVTIKVQTEIEAGTPGAATAGGARHDVYTNRGVIGSQAYAREFENALPDVNDPFSKEMVWLSRGLFEGLINFIDLAKDEKYQLRAALYEFHYQPVANTFAKAVEAGVDVKIVYDDESGYKEDNRTTISNAGLDATHSVIPRTVTEGIRHNKFIVLVHNQTPVAVWTGSTNISAGGIFGHSNVGHVVWDKDVATAYLGYWDRLAKNLTPTKLRPLNRSASPLPVGKTPKGSVVPVFSARDEKESLKTLKWYADRMSEAKRIVCFTVAFNLDEVFQKVISKKNDVLRYIVKDDDLGQGEIIGRDHDVLFAAGTYLGENWLANFRAERDNPLNSNDYIHTKFMLVDPLGNDPLVVVGSANFSRPSQRINDENMLVIRGDTRVADIYFGEFMRIFDHHYARYLVRKLRNSAETNSNAGYLKETSAEWVTTHFQADSYKAKRRKYYVE
jgi:phosphatidylserine/phosphatidylglycerophosphate/cardiolipin synthase-like enzyme